MNNDRRLVGATVCPRIRPDFTGLDLAAIRALERWLAHTKYVRIYRGPRRPYGRQRRARR